jgi:hypothetical protein
MPNAYRSRFSGKNNMGRFWGGESGHLPASDDVDCDIVWSGRQAPDEPLPPFLRDHNAVQVRLWVSRGSATEMQCPTAYGLPAIRGTQLKHAAISKAGK